MTRQEQLDAVARSYGEWHELYDSAFLRESCTSDKGNGACFANKERYPSMEIDGAYLFTREEVETRKNELQNKPSWDDAPKWAESHAQESDGSWYWWNIGSHKLNARNPYKDFWVYIPFGRLVKCEKASKGEVIGDWRDTLEDRPEPETTDGKRGGA